MASRYRTLSRPAVNLLKSAISKPSLNPGSIQSARSSPSLFSRPLAPIGAFLSLLPLHTAVSSARLTSCLGADTKGCRSLSQATPGKKIVMLPAYYLICLFVTCLRLQLLHVALEFYNLIGVIIAYGFSGLLRTRSLRAAMRD